MRKPCCEKQDTNKGAWSKEEDEKLINYIRKHGQGCWRTLPQAAGLLRCGKSCRLRWINYLRPDLKRGDFTEDEEDLIIKLHALLGNRWSLIAGRLPGRTDNEVKNYWNSHLRRKLMKMGIDPDNHRLGVPRRPHTSPSSSCSRRFNLVSAKPPPINKLMIKPESRISDDDDDDNINNDHKSDARSTVEDEEERIISHVDADHDQQLNNKLIPDLNLDLAINPTPNFITNSVDVGAECSRRRLESAIAGHIHELSSSRSPTLLLFQ